MWRRSWTRSNCSSTAPASSSASLVALRDAPSRRDGTGTRACRTIDRDIGSPGPATPLGLAFTGVVAQAGHWLYRICASELTVVQVIVRIPLIRLPGVLALVAKLRALVVPEVKGLEAGVSQAAILETAVIERILTHLGLQARPAPVGRQRCWHGAPATIKGRRCGPGYTSCGARFPSF
jgi:hypothetical protein